MFPRSIGGRDFIVATHEACNRRANSEIDNSLIHCAHVSSARAVIGLRSSRNGLAYQQRLQGEIIASVERPHEASIDGDETSKLLEALKDGNDFGGRGAKVALFRKGNDLSGVRFLGNPVREPDGSISVFQNTSAGTRIDGEGEAQAEETTGRRIVALVEATHPCRHSADTWPRFTAKAGLALLSLIPGSSDMLDDGTAVADVLSGSDLRRLRAHLLNIAFGEESVTDMPPEPFRASEEDRPGSTHAVGLMRSDVGTTVLVRLFGRLCYRLDVEAIELRTSVSVEVPVARADR